MDGGGRLGGKEKSKKMVRICKIKLLLHIYEIFNLMNKNIQTNLKKKKRPNLTYFSNFRLK